MVNLSDVESMRYRRQIIMEEIGISGQLQLKSGSALIIGVGGLGSPVAMYLAAIGIGKLGLVDFDKIEVTNLQRQILHTTPEIGKDKVQSAKEKVQSINPEVCVEAYNLKLSEDNAEQIIAKYDIIVCAVDNIETRQLINKYCVKLSIPMVESSISGFDGQITTLIPNKTACYNCLYPKKNDINKNEEIGVIGTVPAVMGSLQANEVMKFFLRKGKLLENEVLVYNALFTTFRKFKINRRENCEVCG